MMKRFLLAISATALFAALVPATGLAQTIEIGVGNTALSPPVCPVGVSANNCTIVLTQVTALQTVRSGIANPAVVTKAGDLVAFSLGVSALSTNPKTVAKYISGLNSTYGGPAEAQLTVLRPYGKRSLLGWAVAAQSPVYQLQPYLGQVVQFVLTSPLPVVPGEAVALTVPTWAPVLSIDLPKGQYAYSQSRKATSKEKCTNSPTSGQAQTAIGDRAHYQCVYAGVPNVTDSATAVQYSATEITSPIPSY
jgi:hypothetical protein